MNSGEVRKVFFIGQGGAGYRNNRVNGQNAWAPFSLSGDTVAVGKVTLSDTAVSLSRAGSNTYYLADVEYKLIAYYWEDSQKLPMIASTSDMTNAQQVSNFLKNYAEDNAYTVFTIAEEDLSNLSNNGMISYTVRKQNGTSVVLSGSRYRNGAQETISNPTSNAYDCVLNNGDLIYRAVIPLNGIVYRGQVELDGLLNNTITAYESDKVTSIKDYTFRACTSIRYLNLPNCLTLGDYAFMQCSNLETMILPSCTTVYGNCIYSCSKLTDLQLPNCTALYFDSCRGNNRLPYLVLPKCGSFGNNCFSGNTSMEWVDIGVTANFQQNVFISCSSLVSLVLRGNTISTLGNTNSFSGTPFRNGTGGTAYVPYSLVNTYSTATNWVSLESTTFTSIEKNLIALNTLGIDITDYYEIVTTLPTSDIATDKVYLIETQTTGTYEQWFYGSGSWQQLADITL